MDGPSCPIKLQEPQVMSVAGRSSSRTSEARMIGLYRDHLVSGEKNSHLDVSENRGFSPQIIHFNRVFHCKPSILEYPYFLETPMSCMLSIELWPRTSGWGITFAWIARKFAVFLQILDDIPIPEFQLSVDLESLQVWKDTIRHLKNGKAPGIDFWRPEELKLLPDNALCDLKDIFSKKIWQRGMPPKMMVAKNCFVSQKWPATKYCRWKTYHNPKATLTRLASKILADQLLRQLADRLPLQISGGLPQRGTKDLMMQQQYVIEQAVGHKNPSCVATRSICLKPLIRFPDFLWRQFLDVLMCHRLSFIIGFESLNKLHLGSLTHM